MAKILLDNGKEVFGSPVYLRDLSIIAQQESFCGVTDELREKAEEDGLDIVVGYFLPSDNFDLE